jgi:peptide/nickel transport system permease protein
LSTLREIMRSRRALVASIVLSVLVFAAIAAPLLTPQNPYDLMQLDLMDSRLPPGSQGGNLSTYWFGTDDQGRDLYSAILYGLRISLFVGIVSAIFSALIGTTIGVVAGYTGGRLETVAMRLVDFQLSFPAILIALVILATLGRSVANVILALIVVEWASYARIARAAALVESKKEYVESARCLGTPPHILVLKHLLPNCLPPIIVIGTIQIARAISLEATLSFLGLGVPITEPSLGLLVSNGYRYLFAGDYWLMLFPGLTLCLIVVSVNLIGDRLRDVFNPRA